MELEFDEHDNKSQEIINEAIDNLIRISMDAFEDGIRLSDINGTLPKERWNFHSGLFFAVTVLTSIGKDINFILLLDLDHNTPGKTFSYL